VLSCSSACVAQIAGISIKSEMIFLRRNGSPFLFGDDYGWNGQISLGGRVAIAARAAA
jgi:hypothetical protein